MTRMFARWQKIFSRFPLCFQTDAVGLCPCAKRTSQIHVIYYEQCSSELTNELKLIEREQAAVGRHIVRRQSGQADVRQFARWAGRLPMDHGGMTKCGPEFQADQGRQRN